MKLKWLAGIAACAVLATVAVAQTIATFNLTGSELFRGQLGQGGTGILVPAYVLRSGENATLVATATAATTTVPNTSGLVLATGALSTWVVYLPTSPYTGQKVTINCPGGSVTTLTITTITAPVNASIVGTNPTSCTSGGTIAQGSSWTYSTSANTWYRYQ